jgi:hypothetical protein
MLTREEKLGVVLRAVYGGALGGLAGYFLSVGHLVEGLLAVTAFTAFLIGININAIEDYVGSDLLNPIYIIALILVIGGVTLLALGRVNFTEFMEIIMIAINLVLGKGMRTMEYAARAKSKR